MKATVLAGLAQMRPAARYPAYLNTAFRRVVELGPELSYAQWLLASVRDLEMRQLRLLRVTGGYVLDGLPSSWNARLVPDGDRWVLIVKRPQRDVACTERFASPFDALTALQAEIDPRICLLRR